MRKNQSEVSSQFKSRILLGICLFGATAVCGSMFALGREQTPTVHGFKVVKSYPHDKRAFSQGLVFHDGILYEGTGQYGDSSLRKVDLETGKVLKNLKLKDEFFGEGITIWEDKIYQLTWKNKLVFVYDRESFKHEKTFRYSGEGWGLTHNGTHLIMSDGSANLRFLDPKTFKVVKRITVRVQRHAIKNLNELEYINNEIWANVWLQDQIVRISPETGQVVGWIDLRELFPARKRTDSQDVLNGIAFDREKKRLFVTGKNWPRLFEIKLVKQ